MTVAKIAKKYGICLGLFLLCGCSSRMMTLTSYDQIQVGEPIKAVVEKNGDPYGVDTKNGSTEYKYVEKVTSGNRLIYENHYTIYVKDGNVVGKTSVQERRPAYDLIYQDDPNHNQYP
jgi:hypothetical protein